MVVGKGDLLGLLARICSCLRNKVFASLAAKTKQNKTTKSLFSSKTAVLWAREVIFNYVKHLVSLMFSKMSELMMVSIDTSMASEG